MKVSLIVAFVTIIGSLYLMLKSMQKEWPKKSKIREENHNVFLQEMKLENKRSEAMWKLILEQTYGKNIPEELK